MAAIVLFVMALIFVRQFRDAQVTTLDRSLVARSAPSVAALRESSPPDFPDMTPSGHAASSAIDAFTIVYKPDGALAASTPIVQAIAPLSDSQRAAATKRPIHGDTTVSGEPFRIYAQPVVRADGTWLVVSAASYRSTDQAVAAVTEELLVGVPLLLLLSGLGAWVLGGLALRSVGRMRAEAAALGAHDAGGRITEPSARELNALAHTFNQLLDRLFRSMQHQRSLVADASHELRTPLAVLSTELELADSPGRSREELADSVSHARSEVDRLTSLADSLLFLARADRGAAISQTTTLRVSCIIAESARAYESRCALAGVDLRIDVPGALVVTADGPALRRAIDNLLTNALNHTQNGDVVRVEARQTGDAVTITVSDSGAGFPVDFLPHAFERFRKADVARTRTSVSGSGLGLAIVQEIARAHGGSVRAANVPGGGARVTIRIPNGPPG